ncbi:MAG: hypothetical protein KJ949_02800 [Nanoarchaeota archaeon]|nr:hypothetical protein [Nanoarchaeota archaeon]
MVKKKKPVKKKNSVKKKAHVKKTLPKKKIKTPIKIPNNDKEIEKLLIQNFIALQKVMTHLSLKFENLTLEISKLLELFEISAKSLAKKDFESDQGKKDEEKVMKKIDTLLDQNRIIAKGLTLLHEKNPEETFINRQIPRPMPPQQPHLNQPMQNSQRPPQPNSSETINTGGYQKSISSQIPNIDDPKRLQKNAQQNQSRV